MSQTAVKDARAVAAQGGGEGPSSLAGAGQGTPREEWPGESLPVGRIIIKFP